MKNQKIFYVFTLISCMLFSALISVAATGNLFDSNEVTYDNTASGMNSSNVKGALDELYAAANDYSSINSRVSTLESNYDKYFLNNPTSRFNGNGLQLGVTGTSYAWADWYNNGTNYGNIHASGNKFNIYSNYPLEITGNPVKINGTDYTNVEHQAATIDITTTRTFSSSSINYTKIGRVVVVSLYDVCPSADGQGNTILAKGLPPAYIMETGMILANSNGSLQNSYRVAIKNDGRLYWWWTPGSTTCASASGQLVYITAS